MSEYYNRNFYQDMYGGNTQKERVENAVKKHGVRVAKQMYPGILKQHPSYFKGKKQKVKSQVKKPMPIGFQRYRDCRNEKNKQGISFKEAKELCKKVPIPSEDLQEILEEIKEEQAPIQPENLQEIIDQPSKSYSESDLRKILKCIQYNMNRNKMSFSQAVKKCTS